MLKAVYEDVSNFSCSDLYLRSVGAPAGNKIWGACHEIAHMLIEKNISYGNSALEPARIFSTADSTEQLKVRIDDKLNRVKNNQGLCRILRPRVCNNVTISSSLRGVSSLNLFR